MSLLSKRLRVDDLLGEITNAVAAAELPTECGCGCGTPLDGTFTSLDFASLACQNLWSNHPGDTTEARQARAVERAAYTDYQRNAGWVERTWPPERDDKPWTREQQLTDFRLLDDKDDRELLDLSTRQRHALLAEREAPSSAGEGISRRVNGALRAAEEFLANPMSGIRRERPMMRMPQAFPGEASEWRALTPQIQRYWWDVEHGHRAEPRPAPSRRVLATTTVEQTQPARDEAVPLTWTRTPEDWHHMGRLRQRLWMTRNMAAEVAARHAADEAAAQRRYDDARRASLLNLATALDVPHELLEEAWPSYTYDEEAARAWVAVAMNDIVAAHERQQDAREDVAARVATGTADVLEQMRREGDAVVWFYNPATGEWGLRS